MVSREILNSDTKLWSVSWYCCTVNAAKSEVFPIKASSLWWAQITILPCGLTQQWSDRRKECVLQVWMGPCVSVKRFSTASNDAFLAGSWDVWGHFGLEKFYSFIYFQPSWWGGKESSHIDRKLECQDLWKLKHVYSWYFQCVLTQ